MLPSTSWVVTGGPGRLSIVPAEGHVFGLAVTLRDAPTFVVCSQPPPPGYCHNSLSPRCISCLYLFSRLLHATSNLSHSSQAHSPKSLSIVPTLTNRVFSEVQAAFAAVSLELVVELGINSSITTRKTAIRWKENSAGWLRGSPGCSTTFKPAHRSVGWKCSDCWRKSPTRSNLHDRHRTCSRLCRGYFLL